MAVAAGPMEPDAGAARSARALGKRILGWFVVEPSSGRALGYIDGLRALAIIGVIAAQAFAVGTTQGHEPKSLVGVPLTPWHVDVGPIAYNGRMGVSLFFVLSGFLLAQPWLRANYTGAPRPRVYTYYKLRVFRLVPAYYVCLFLTLFFFTPVFIRPELVYSQDGLLILLAHLIFVQGLVPIASTAYNFDNVFWTLTIAAIFYLLLPVMVPFFYRKRWLFGLPAAVAIQVGWLYACQHSFGGLAQAVQASVAHNPYVAPSFDSAGSLRFLRMQLPGYLADFALGITCANFFTRLRLNLPAGGLIRALTARWAGAVYFTLGVALTLLVMYTVPLPNGTDYAPWWNAYPAFVGAISSYGGEAIAALACVLLLAGLCFGFAGMRAAFSVLPLRVTGIVSYSIYLWHLPLMLVIAHNPAIVDLSPADRFARVFALSLVLVVPFAAFMYLAVERPFIRSARTKARARAAAEAVAAKPVAMPVRFPRFEDVVEAPTETQVPAVHLARAPSSGLAAADLSQAPTADLPAMPAADSGSPSPLQRHHGHGGNSEGTAQS